MQYKIKTQNKIIFLLLSANSLILLMNLTTILWILITNSLHAISTMMADIILLLLRLFYIAVIIGLTTLIIESYAKFSIRPLHKLIRFALTFIFPVNVFIGKCLFIPIETIRESFVNVNNAFIKTGKQKFKAKDTLILLPHCLQNYDCQYRITNQIDNCTDCGKCTVSQLKRLAKQYKTHIAIATGGTLARKIVVQTKPKCIIAVACQRDLVEGLLEVFPIPVFGVLNERPNGPCISTSVDLNEIEDFLKYIIIKEEI